MMKLLVVCLEGLSAETMLANERCEVIGHLMSSGCFGKVKRCLPSTPSLAWECFAHSQDPGSLGSYGSVSRVAGSYDLVDRGQVQSNGERIWDPIFGAGQTVHLIGVPVVPESLQGPGLVVGRDGNVSHSGISLEELGNVEQLLGDDTSAESECPLEAAKAQCANWLGIARHLIQNAPADYTQVHLTGLASLLEANADDASIHDYLQFVDTQLGGTLEVLDEQFVICLVSGYGVRRRETSFHINDWLVQQGWLVLEETPKAITSFGEVRVNWSQTKAWAAGEGEVQLFLNVAGRDPEGILAPEDCLAFRDELKLALENLSVGGARLDIEIAKPEESYRNVNGMTPDLVVAASESGVWCDARVGHECLTTAEQGGQACRGDDGLLVLVAANSPLSGELADLTLLDVAPTLLDLSGRSVPEAMQGTSMLADSPASAESAEELSEEELIRQRLSGLGYI